MKSARATRARLCTGSLLYGKPPDGRDHRPAARQSPPGGVRLLGGEHPGSIHPPSGPDGGRLHAGALLRSRSDVVEVVSHHLIRVDQLVRTSNGLYYPYGSVYRLRLTVTGLAWRRIACPYTVAVSRRCSPCSRE